MTEWFADTSYFLALLSPRDVAHAKAVALSTPMRRRVVTTTAVLIEVGDAFAGSHRRRSMAEFIRRLWLDQNAVILSVDKPLLDRAVDLYEDRPDKQWSLTDCISFVVMRDRGVREALTGDHHFEQAGFVALLK